MSCQALPGPSRSCFASLLDLFVSKEFGGWDTRREDINLTVRDNMLTLAALKPQIRNEGSGKYEVLDVHTTVIIVRIIANLNIRINIYIYILIEGSTTRQSGTMEGSSAMCICHTMWTVATSAQ